MSCHKTEIFSLSGAVAAAGFVAPPSLTLIPDENATQSWQVGYELLGISLTSSLTNFGTALMGLFVVVASNTKTISYGKSTQSILAHISGNNSIVGPPAVAIPSDKTVTRVFLQPIFIPGNTRISLYACGDTTAGNALSAFVSLDMRRVG